MGTRASCPDYYPQEFSNMNEVTTFTAPAGMNVRVVTIDGNPWFVAADVCRALGLTPHNGSFTHHLTRLQVGEARKASRSDVEVPLRGGNLMLVSESGLYKLVLRSDKPEAREFQDWVTREVLPSIRKHGIYVAGQEK